MQYKNLYKNQDLKVIGKQFWSRNEDLAGSSLARRRRVSRKLTISSRSDGDNETRSVTVEKGERRPVSEGGTELGMMSALQKVSCRAWRFAVRARGLGIVVRETFISGRLRIFLIGGGC